MTRFATPRKDVGTRAPARRVAKCRKMWVDKKDTTRPVPGRPRPPLSQNVPECPSRKKILAPGPPGRLLLGPDRLGIRVAFQEVPLLAQRPLGRLEVDVVHQ